MSPAAQAATNLRIAIECSHAPETVDIRIDELVRACGGWIPFGTQPEHRVAYLVALAIQVLSTERPA